MKSGTLCPAHKPGAVRVRLVVYIYELCAVCWALSTIPPPSVAVRIYSSLRWMGGISRREGPKPADLLWYYLLLLPVWELNSEICLLHALRDEVELTSIFLQQQPSWACTGASSGAHSLQLSLLQSSGQAGKELSLKVNQGLLFNWFFFLVYAWLTARNLAMLFSWRTNSNDIIQIVKLKFDFWISKADCTTLKSLSVEVEIKVNFSIRVSF